MKDLLKGHNPLMLFFVALMSLFFAFAVRNKIIGEGHTDLNANFFFFMVLASCIGIYFLIHEGIKEFTDFFYKKSWKKRGTLIQKTESQPATIPTAETFHDESPKEFKEQTQTQNCTPGMTPEQMIALVKAIKESDVSEHLTNEREEDKDVVNFDLVSLSCVAANAQCDIEADLQATLKEATLYTVEVLGPYMTTEHMHLLITRLSKFQRAGAPKWTVLEKDETEIHKVHTHSPIVKADLYHYGWNMGALFGKSGPQTAYFLQTTFYHHFDSLQLTSIVKKLTNDPTVGVIKLNKEFSPNYRRRTEKAAERNRLEMAKEYEEEQKQRKFEAQEERRKKAEERYHAQTDEKDVAPQGPKREVFSAEPASDSNAGQRYNRKQDNPGRKNNSDKSQNDIEDEDRPMSDEEADAEACAYAEKVSKKELADLENFDFSEDCA